MKIEVKGFKSLSEFLVGDEEPISFGIFESYEDADVFIEKELSNKTGFHYYTKPIME